MRNIASVRLSLVLALAPVAAMAGFALSPPPAPEAIIGGQTVDTFVAPLGAADVAVLVERLGSTGLFPGSIPLERPTSEVATEAVETDLIDLEGELGEGAPRIRALYALDGQWRVIARFADGRQEVLQQGELIYNEWRILAIGPNGIEIASDSEQRSINVFVTQDI